MKHKGFVCFGILLLVAISIAWTPFDGNLSVNNIAAGYDTDIVPVTELTPEQYALEIEKFYQELPPHIVVIDLEDSKGIDPALLPDEIAELVRNGTKVTRYKVTRFLPSEKAPGLAKLCEKTLLDIPCADRSGTIDTERSSVYGSIEQYNRVLAYYYDDYPGCSPDQCTGYEVIRQYSRWTRTNSNWTVSGARISTIITNAKNYCTQASDSISRVSGYFTPTWADSVGTNTYYIDVAPGKAVVPSFASGYSRTEGDIFEGSILRKAGLTTDYIWSMWSS